ncbi:MAG: NRDE family protein [Acidobacteria bacterium]|nr:NRDE family protein [Acidobacteriota bacterium]
MCLIIVSHRTHPRYELVVAANRDEFYCRPTQAAAFWSDAPTILAGRDLQSRGTWMGMTREGRFAAVTNFREPQSPRPDAPSRGLLVRDFLLCAQPATEYLKEVRGRTTGYAGFCLVARDRLGLAYCSNRSGSPVALGDGIYAVSNGFLDDPWPKVVRGKEAVRRTLDRFSEPGEIAESLFSTLAERDIPPDRLLPDTGVGLERERVLAPIFVTTKLYGTRSSSVVIVERDGMVWFEERSFSDGGFPIGRAEFSFRIEDA